jgi:hypothetical protein
MVTLSDIDDAMISKINGLIASPAQHDLTAFRDHRILINAHPTNPLLVW